VRFFYLDTSGVWSLFEQTVNDLQDEFDRLYKTNPTGGLEEKTSMALRLSELLGLDASTAEGTFGRSKKFIEELKAKLSVENKVTRLVEYQRDLDSTGSLPVLDLAVQRWRYSAPNMVLLNEYFNMPQFYQGAQSEALSYESGFVEFELDRRAGIRSASERHYACATYSRQREKPRVLISASLSKFQNLRLGKMSPESPESKFFHQSAGLRVPLHVLGTLTKNIDHLRIKPLVIWR